MQRRRKTVISGKGGLAYAAAGQWSGKSCYGKSGCRKRCCGKAAVSMYARPRGFYQRLLGGFLHQRFHGVHVAADFFPYAACHGLFQARRLLADPVHVRLG